MLLSPLLTAQETGQYQFWQEIAVADQTFAARSSEIGRTRAFLEILGEDSVVFREGPVDALALYSSDAFKESASEINWKAHYIDVSRAGDLGLSAGPLTIIDQSGDSDQNRFGHLISIFIGIVFNEYMGISFVSLGLSVGVCVSVMMYLKIVHPPAAANPLIALFADVSYDFIIFPIITGSIMLIFLSFLINRFVLGRKYPKKWL